MNPTSDNSDRLLRITILACFAVAVYFGFRAFQPDSRSILPSAAAEVSSVRWPSEAVDSAAGSQAVPEESAEFVTKSIEDIRLGARVVGTNPLREQIQRASDIIPATGR